MSFVLNLSTCVGLPVRCPPTTLRVSRKTREEVEVDTDGDATGPEYGQLLLKPTFRQLVKSQNNFFPTFSICFEFFKVIFHFLVC